MPGGSPADVPAVCQAGGRGGEGRWCEGTRRLNPTHCQSCLLPAGAMVVSVLSDMRVRAEEQQENDSVSLPQLPAGALPNLSCTSLAPAESRGKRGCGPSPVPVGGTWGRFAHPSHGSRGSKSIPLREESWTGFLEPAWLLKPGLK